MMVVRFFVLNGVMLVSFCTFGMQPTSGSITPEAPTQGSSVLQKEECTCQYCKRICANKRSLKHHESTLCKKSPFWKQLVCSGCGIVKNNQTELSKHMRYCNKRLKKDSDQLDGLVKQPVVTIAQGQTTCTIETSKGSRTLILPFKKRDVKN
jgi:hypothetical protein